MKGFKNKIFNSFWARKTMCIVQFFIGELIIVECYRTPKKYYIYSKHNAQNAE